MSTNGRPLDQRQAFEIVETPSTEAIERLIVRTRRMLRSAWTSTGLAITCGIFVSALLMVTIVDLAMPLSRFLRVSGWLAVFVSGAASFVLGVVIPCLRRLTAVKVAHRIESHLPGIHNRLVSCVELTDASEEARRSPVFHRRLVTEALGRIRGFQPQKVLDVRLLKRAALFAGGGFAAFVIAALVFGDRLPTAVARIFNPLADIPPNSGVVYDVLIGDRSEPGDCSILRGEDVAFTVVVRHGQVDPPGGTDPLRLELKVADADGSRRRVWYDFGQLRDNRVRLSLNDMQQPCTYRVHGGGTWSKQYSLAVLDRPRITAVRSALHFPDYMRIKQPQVTQDDVAHISAQVDSLVEVSVSFEGDVSEGEIELLAPAVEGGFTVVEKIALSPAESRTEWQGSFGLQQDGFYRVVLRNELGYANRRMKEGKLTALPDNPPQVVLARPTEDIVVTSPLEIPVQAAAFDDFGLESITLVVEHSYWGETRQTHPMASGQPPRNEDALFVLDLAEQRLRHEDRIECRIEAQDTKGQVAVSERFSVRVANQREAADRELVDLQEELDAARSMLDSLIREQNRADEIISELAQAPSDPAVQPAAEDDLWERDEELAELARLEEQNAELAEQLAEALAQTAERAAEAQLLPAAIAEQIAAAERAIEPTVQQPLEQLQELAEQLAQPQSNREQAAAAERLSDHLQDNLADLQARLDAIQQAQEASPSGLEQALADFDRELAEQNAQAAARELSELSDFVNDLREDLEQHQAEQTELTAQNNPSLTEPALDSLAQQQEALEQRAREDLREASELLNTEAIDDLAQDSSPPENGEADNPFEVMPEAADSDDLWEEAGAPEAARDEQDQPWEEEAFDSKSKEPSFKPAIDASKQGFEQPAGQEPGEPSGHEPQGQPGDESGDAAGAEEPGGWEDAFEGPAEAGESHEGPAPGSQHGTPEPSAAPPTDANNPRARFAQQQQQHAEQLSSAAESLAADQQTLDDLVSELAEMSNPQQPAAAPSAGQLRQLMNSPAMQQALAMQQRMNAMQLPPSLARHATAQLMQSQGSPEGARTMSGAVEQILVELGETDPQAASLLMRMQPQQREDLLQGLRQGGPKGYRKFIRDYFIRLSQAGAR